MSAIDIVAEGDERRVRMLFDEHEAPILAEVAGQLARLLRDTPDDSAAVALFPRGYDEPTAQAEFSRFTHSELNERKIAAAEQVAAALAAESHPDAVVVTLDAETAWTWLTFFTDLRLVLAERLRTDAQSEEHGLQQGLSDWAAYLQGSLVDALAEIRF